ncbi:hypothetical protein ACLB1O_04395 [Escherichia coli]
MLYLTPRSTRLCRKSLYLYALPYNLYKEHGIRRYGAHGTSHFYVTQEAAKMLNKPVEELNIITCHLGDGCVPFLLSATVNALTPLWA